MMKIPTEDEWLYGRICDYWYKGKIRYSLCGALASAYLELNHRMPKSESLYAHVLGNTDEDIIALFQTFNDLWNEVYPNEAVHRTMALNAVMQINDTYEHSVLMNKLYDIVEYLK